MSIFELKVGDKLKVLIPTNSFKTINTLNDVIEITGIATDINDTLWIRHIPNSFSGGGFRITNDKSQVSGYELGSDVVFIPKIKENYNYLIKLFRKLDIK